MLKDSRIKPSTEQKLYEIDENTITKEYAGDFLFYLAIGKTEPMMELDAEKLQKRILQNERLRKHIEEEIMKWRKVKIDKRYSPIAISTLLKLLLEASEDHD